MQDDPALIPRGIIGKPGGADDALHIIGAISI